MVRDAVLAVVRLLSVMNVLIGGVVAASVSCQGDHTRLAWLPLLWAVLDGQGFGELAICWLLYPWRAATICPGESCLHYRQ